MSKEREQLMTLLGQLIKGMVEDKQFLLILKHPDESLDFVTNDKDVVSTAAKFIELIDKK